ncbi:peptidyl-Asp metalloendopeptidase [Stenotrophomonas sp. Sa5BUN4]|uniref:Peptidyl-Asp metalloendopeptidase n=1 Tax=Stenotrophomonas lacuserhaii TaxID=2760084 RepID=A0A8X8K1S2_9GAMM|nr:M12 family metallo-peptidase [Stenotrophomonas pennii]MBD7955913.1 peptidyl-Asp metalloendopeptidase [Stenotrophomonas pennii]
MSHHSKYTPLATALALLVSGGATAAPLFEPATGPAPRAGTDAGWAHLQAEPSTDIVQALRMNVAALSDDRLELPLGERMLQVRRIREEAAADGSLVWYGAEEDAAAPLAVSAQGAAAPASVILVQAVDGSVTGTIRDRQQRYDLRPVGHGEHALVKVDEHGLPPMHPLGMPSLPAPPAPPPAPDVQARSGDPGGWATIRVLVIATQGAINAYGGNMRAKAELAVAESNEGFKNGWTNIRMELADYRTTGFPDGRMGDDLGRLQNPGDGQLDEVHALRDAARADVVVMLTDGKDACGVGYINAPASHAFAVVGWRCATGNYTFAHEVGHVLGANHDRANASGSPYPYGHGYQFSLGSGERFRTIMSYDCPGGCTRINSWSNPGITYGGARTGDAATADNQRVLVQRKHVVAGFR